MVKIYCDRCKEELDKKYYTINFWEYDTNPKYEPFTTCTATSDYSAESRDGALKFLNSRKMYCKSCKDKIEDFINKKEEKVEICNEASKTPSCAEIYESEDAWEARVSSYGRF